MDANVVSILRGLGSNPGIQVVFLINREGKVLVSVGDSPAFSHTGTLGPTPDSAEDDLDTSLYLTAVAPGVFLGVLFEAESDIEEVREEVRGIESLLGEAIHG